MITSIKCLMNGLEVNYPCSPVCALFGDCVTAFEAQKKENVRTNADRIRAKSDEELANWMYRYQVAVIKDALGVISTEAAELFEVALSANPNLDDVLNWLKQPAGGEACGRAEAGVVRV